MTSAFDKIENYHKERNSDDIYEEMNRERYADPAGTAGIHLFNPEVLEIVALQTAIDKGGMDPDISLEQAHENPLYQASMKWLEYTGTEEYTKAIYDDMAIIDSKELETMKVQQEALQNALDNASPLTAYEALDARVIGFNGDKSDTGGIISQSGVRRGVEYLKEENSDIYTMDLEYARREAIALQHFINEGGDSEMSFEDVKNEDLFKDAMKTMNPEEQAQNLTSDVNNDTSLAANVDFGAPKV